MQRALKLGHVGPERRERRAPAPQHDAAEERREGDDRGADGQLQPPPPLLGARPEPGSPAANGRWPDWPRRPLKLGGSVGPPLGLGPASSSWELAGDAAGVGSKVTQP